MEIKEGQAVATGISNEESRWGSLPGRFAGQDSLTSWACTEGEEDIST